MIKSILSLIFMRTITHLCETDPNVSLADTLRGGNVKIDWVHMRHPPTGAARAQSIHNRIHKQAAPTHWRATGPGESFTHLSAVFALLMMIPAVASTVYSICRWVEVDETKLKVIALVTGLASSFGELGQIRNMDRMRSKVRRLLMQVVEEK
jgi:hypothetical protein